MLKVLGRPLCLCGAIVLLVPALAHAEGFVDFGIGGAFTQKSDISFESGGSSSPTAEAEFDDSFAVGVRGGYWFDGLPWLGVGGTVSYFEPDVGPTVSGYGTRHLGVVPITALLMLRAPLLPCNTVPRGQLQPYLNVGPGAFVTATDENHYTGDNHNHETSVDVGVDVHAGVTWMFTSRFGMFGEYRFTHYTANLDEGSHYHSYGFSATLDTHHVMTGFAWHFH